MKPTNIGHALCKSPLLCCRKELISLADLLTDIWNLQVKANMLEPNYIGNAIFWQLVKHALTRTPVSMKHLNAEIHAAHSGIRRAARNLQKNQWASNGESADDRRVRQLLPTEKLERRAIQFMLNCNERISRYSLEHIINKPVGLSASHKAVNCALCRSKII